MLNTYHIEINFNETIILLFNYNYKIHKGNINLIFLTIIFM